MFISENQDLLIHDIATICIFDLLSLFCVCVFVLFSHQHKVYIEKYFLNQLALLKSLKCFFNFFFTLTINFKETYGKSRSFPKNNT